MKNLNKFVLLVLLSSTQSTNTIGLLGFITSPNFQEGVKIAATVTTASVIKSYIRKNYQNISPLKYHTICMKCACVAGMFAATIARAPYGQVPPLPVASIFPAVGAGIATFGVTNLCIKTMKQLDNENTGLLNLLCSVTTTTGLLGYIAYSRFGK